MVNKRIYEYEPLDELTPNHWFSIDRPTSSTGKITYKNMGSQLLASIDKIDNWKFAKIDDDTFSITSQLYDEEGIAPDLINNQEITIASFGQMKPQYQPNPNPDLIVNGITKKVYNGIAYERWGLTALDTNTFWERGMSFVYDTTLDAFLLYKHYRDSYSFIWTDQTANAGMFFCDGTEILADKYPILSTLYTDDLHIEDMGNATFTGNDYANNNTLFGSIPDTRIGGSIWGKAKFYGVGQVFINSSNGLQGDIKIEYVENTMVTYVNRYTINDNTTSGHTIVGEYDFQGTVILSGPLSNYTNTASETLTKRYARCPHRVL